MTAQRKMTPHGTLTPMPILAPSESPLAGVVPVVEGVEGVEAVLWAGPSLADTVSFVVAAAATWRRGAEGGVKDGRSLLSHATTTSRAFALKEVACAMVILDTTTFVASVMRPWQFVTPGLNVMLLRF